MEKSCDIKSRLHRFEGDISGIALPRSFGDPFCAEPHALVSRAAELVLPRLGAIAALAEGKMMGVLVVRDDAGELAYLAAYSGDVACTEAQRAYFVPPLLDLDEPGGFYERLDAEVMRVDRLIREVEGSATLRRAVVEAGAARERAEQAIAGQKERNRQAKQQREERRAAGADAAALVRESQYERAELKRLRRRLLQPVEALEAQIAGYERDVERLKQQRRMMSEAVQREIFALTRVLNARCEQHSLLQIFEGLPPSGAGSCAAPKLLQYAFAQGLAPLAMGEFWYGAPLGGRQQGRFYPSCESRCRPILGFMLQGVERYFSRS